MGMREKVLAGVVLAGLLVAAPALHAQQQSSGQSKPAAEDAKPAAQPTEANPFPEDTSAVPVVPTTATPAAPPPDFHADSGDSSNIHLPSADADPVRSPDDAAQTSGTGAKGDSSSSSGFADLERLLEPPADDRKHKREEAAPRKTGPAEDINVGSYYLETSNWRAALSRFESALVLAPESPEVYWGLAESQRHLGDYARAKANYLKVLEYDPGSKHSKDARKILRQPEIANAPDAPAGAPAPAQPLQ